MCGHPISGHTGGGVGACHCGCDGPCDGNFIEFTRPPKNLRKHILDTADGYVNGDRNVDYGDPRSDFQTTASFWQTYLRRIIEARGELVLRPHDVAQMMILLKSSRISWSPEKEDHWVDQVGYGACGAECVIMDAQDAQVEADRDVH